MSDAIVVRSPYDGAEVGPVPDGGVRESGNTKEGPAYAVRQMTEERLVVIQP